MPPVLSVDMLTIRFTPYATQIKPTVTSDVSAAWSVNHGSVAPASGLTTLFTPENRTEVATVTATATGSSQINIQIYATIPFQPNFGYEQDWDNKTLRSEAEDGSAKLRLKGPVKRSWQVAFNNVPYTDWPSLRDFFMWHQKHLPFFYEDLEVPENLGSGEVKILTLVTFDAGLKMTIAGPQRYNITTAFREV